MTEQERASNGITMTSAQWLAALAHAWDLGYHRAVLDTTSDIEPADNPYETAAAPADPSTQAPADERKP